MIQPISGLISSAAQSSAAVGVKASPEIQRPDGETQDRAQKPMMDEYVPEEKQEPSGRYWLGKDEKGQPKVYFDNPEQTADASEDRDKLPDADRKSKQPGAPEKKAADDAETCSTDAVDREIEKLKKKKEKLEQQINSEMDEAKIEELEKQLAQVERELRQKDTDAYRRQHAVFS